MVWFADMSTEKTAMIVSNYTADETAGKFCQGAAAASARIRRTREWIQSSTRDDLHRLLHAGIRAVDIRDPSIRRKWAISSRRSPTRPNPALHHRRRSERCKTAIQTNNVDTDARGYIYIVDRANTGLHIPRAHRGAARQAAGLP